MNFTDLTYPVRKKKWYKSKTVWVNAVALAASIVSMQFGVPITPEMQGGVLAVINIVLRLVTKQPVDWGPRN